MTEAVIVSAVRTPVGKAPNGMLRATRPDELAATAIAEALKRAPGANPADVDDVIVGCAMPEAEQGLNVARIASLRAGVPVSAAAVTVNRFCSSGLQAIAQGAERVMCGSASLIVAGGVESMSLVPMGGNKLSPNPALVDSYPDVYLSTGLVAENHARESQISREAQDAFALESHRRAIAAIDAGRFAEETVSVAARLTDHSNGRPHGVDVPFSVDEGPRRDTSLEALGKLRPAFHPNGSVTAGNSSQTSDGAAAVIVTSREYAREHGLTPLARFVTYATAGVKPELFGIGPVPAIRKALAQASLKLDDIDLIELNEAFAAQVLACLKELPIDPARLNVNGGAIALGHPLGCTGAKLTATLLHEMKRRGSRYGLVTMCVGGGMGAAGIFERME
ncbi:MAG TPA: acetyl-CoA C-acyltransferase [Vicinamibacterales bacterium]|jgi:acetyl-CoA acyltransferase|nr:acetyl-CoA C-acyltransferase [Vicinamibacterales bacterium]